MAPDIICVFTSCHKNDQLPLNLLKDTFFLTNTLYMRETCSIRKRQSLKIDPRQPKQQRKCSGLQKTPVATCSFTQKRGGLPSKSAASPALLQFSNTKRPRGLVKESRRRSRRHHRLRGRSRPNFLAQQEWGSVERIRKTKKNGHVCGTGCRCDTALQ